MAQITEDYVSFETAKLLKEKGFDGECIAYYSIYKDNNASLHRWRNRRTYVNVKNDGYTIVPTLQMAMKWLREVHNVAIVITPSMFKGRYNAAIYKRNNVYPFGFYGDSLIPSYEEACETAIKYCLENLI